MPANAAVAVNDRLDYSFVKVIGRGLHSVTSQLNLSAVALFVRSGVRVGVV
jgi:hypothetical protein